jgi:hypothetical protein
VSILLTSASIAYLNQTNTSSLDMFLIIPFVNFAFNFFLVRMLCSTMKPQHTWYVVLGMVVVDLGKAAFSTASLEPFDIFLFTIGGMAGSVVGRNEAAKKNKSEGNTDE